MRNRRNGGLLARNLVALLMVIPAWSQQPAWETGIAKVTRDDPDRRFQPGTAFVVAIKDDSAFLVTSAHVVAGDPNPRIAFLAHPDQTYQATVRNPEFDDKRGLALLVVRSAPRGISALRESSGKPPAIRDAVAGFPAVLDNFSAVDTTIASIKARDVFLSRELGAGYSGGPVLREGAVVAIYYGREADYGTALKSSSIRNYLKENGVVWETGGALSSVGPITRPQPGEVTINSADGLPYIWIPPGEFQMGCSPDDKECDDEKPSHNVRISKGFWLGQTEVTQAAYEKVTGETPSHFKGARLPVEQVNWDQAGRYCEAVGGRLPTEAEWEYAARAGSTQARYGERGAIAWFGDNSGSAPLDSDNAWNVTANRDSSEYLEILKEKGNKTHEVGTKQQNAWQLYDMLGNVWEWMSDKYGSDYYKASPSVDPKGPVGGEYRVLRGGSWLNYPGLVRASVRDWNEPGGRDSTIGFRCARE